MWGKTASARSRRSSPSSSRPSRLDCNGWEVQGNFWEWDYQVLDGSREVMTVSKELFHWTDTYVLDIADPADALVCLMIVLAIDAEKCSRNN